MQALELLDPQYIAYAFAVGETLDIDGQRHSFASIDVYVKNAGHLSEQQADQVVHGQTQFQSQGATLLDKYYGQVKDALGPETAARFYEAESQLLSLGNLRRSSMLPVK